MERGDKIFSKEVTGELLHIQLYFPQISMERLEEEVSSMS